MISNCNLLTRLCVRCLGEELTYGARLRRPKVAQFVPAYVVYDKMVLRFGGFFKEAVHESALETYRVRRVQVQFYLEDDSIAVCEPHQPNSGLTQGTLVKRQLVPRGDGSYYGLADLNVGQQVTFYGRTIRLTTCDEFTRKFMADQGIEVPADEPQPRNPYDDARVQLETYSRSHTTDLSQDKLLRFLQDDGKVLRFYAVWEDADRLSKQLRPFAVQYFLADDTVEVREMHSPNDGTDQFPLLLHRSKLPKRFEGLRDFGAQPTDVYTAEDFFIGMTLNVFERQMLLYDCDGFTRTWYRTHLNRDMNAIELSTPAPPPARPAPPPWNGFGSDEDSLGSVNCLEPKPPKKDQVKLMQNDGKVLRFEAKVVTSSEIDKNRKYIISFFLADDTISVFEPPIRNSGIEGGKVLERRQCCYRGTLTPIRVTDFYVGATVEINCTKYLLTDADEYALRYMEVHCDTFTRSNVRAICAGIAKWVRTRRADLAGAFRPFTGAASAAGAASAKSAKSAAGAAGAVSATGAPSDSVSPDEFQDALLSLGIDLSGQEVLTLMREYDVNRNGRIAYRQFVADVTA